MKKIFIFFAIFFAFSVNIFAQSALTESDYQIYAEVLRDIRSRDIGYSKTVYSFVISDATETGISLSGNYEEDKYDGLSQDFARRNQYSLIFEKSFPVNYKYELAAKPEIEKLLAEGKKETMRLKEEEEKSNALRRETGWSEVDWQYFNKKFPTSNGYYRFSAIGYSLNRKFAVVTSEGKGAHWSSNTEYLFRKIGNRWIFEHAGDGFSVS